MLLETLLLLVTFEEDAPMLVKELLVFKRGDTRLIGDIGADAEMRLKFEVPFGTTRGERVNFFDSPGLGEFEGLVAESRRDF